MLLALFLENPAEKQKDTRDTHFFVQWTAPKNKKNQPLTYSVLPREAMKDGSQRGLPEHVLIGRELMIEWKSGHFAPGTILATGILTYSSPPTLVIKHNCHLSLFAGTEESMNERLTQMTTNDPDAQEANSNLPSVHPSNNL